MMGQKNLSVFVAIHLIIVFCLPLDWIPEKGHEWSLGIRRLEGV